MPSEIAPGALVSGRYRVEREIGAGGMGTVWAATDAKTSRPVAMKVIRDSFRSRTELRRRILREARAASAVKHPHVVEMLDVFFIQDDTPVLVMELLEGETLANLLEREESLSLARCAALLLPAISAVGTAHACGVVHRDLKPANIFLARRDTGDSLVKVLDFGVAKLFADEGQSPESQLTGTGSTLGTPSYMAPEQATGQRDVDHLADVWAFGVILYECLSGIRPIEGDTVGQVVMSLMSTGITPLESLVPDLPESITRLVARMLSRERPLRPKDLNEPFTVLKRYTDVRAPAFGAPVSVPVEPETPVSRPQRSGSGRYAVASVIDQPRRKRTAAYVTIGLAVTAIGTAGLLSRSGSTSGAAEPGVSELLQNSPSSAIETRASTPAKVIPTAATAPLAPPEAASTSAAFADKAPGSSSAPRRQSTSRAREASLTAVLTPGTLVPAVSAPAPQQSAETKTTPQPPPATQAAFNGGLAEEVPF